MANIQKKREEQQIRSVLLGAGNVRSSAAAPIAGRAVNTEESRALAIAARRAELNWRQSVPVRTGGTKE